jgi:hypothetical protein
VLQNERVLVHVGPRTARKLKDCDQTEDEDIVEDRSYVIGIHQEPVLGTAISSSIEPISISHLPFI